MGNLKSKYPFCAAWFASAAPLIFSGWVHAQAPIIDASEGYGRGGSSYSSAPAAAPAAASGNMSAELLTQLQALQQEVMQLRGQMEEQAYQLEALRQQSLDRYVDLDKRLSQLQGVPPSAAVPGAAAPAPAAPASGLATPGVVTPGAATPAPAAPSAQAPNGASAAPAPTGAAKPDEQEAYRQAYAKVKAQQFAAAIQSFNAFLADYPNSSLVPNAYYWLGELHLVESPQNLPGAEQAFNTLLKSYPLHNKAPDALYKLGRVEFQKGNKAKARELLQRVIDDYGSSGSSAPQLAKQFLDENFR